MKLRLAFLFFLMLAAFWLPAQTLHGDWFGFLVQPDNPPYEDYVVALSMRQEGDVVTGITHIHLKDYPEIFARMAFRAVTNGEKVFFEEHTLLDHYHFDTYDWCLKRGVLSIEERTAENSEYELVLGGIWEGFTKEVACSPGDMKVVKVSQSPSSVDEILKREMPAQLVEEIVAKKMEPLIKEKPIEKEPPEDPVVAKVEPKNHGELEGRAITRLREVNVSQGEVTAYVWDMNKVDGDIISLSFNGEWVLKDYSLKKEKKPVELKILPGSANRLVLYAEDMGSIPPNTCGLTFFDGKQHRNLSLVSDKVSCGALQFNWEK